MISGAGIRTNDLLNITLLSSPQDHGSCNIVFHLFAYHLSCSKTFYNEDMQL